MTPQSNILIYQTEDGQTKIQTRLEDETVWINIDQMVELFQKSRSTINEHILNIYKEEELEKDESMRKIGNTDFLQSLQTSKKCGSKFHFLLHIEKPLQNVIFLNKSLFYAIINKSINKILVIMMRLLKTVSTCH